MPGSPGCSRTVSSLSQGTITSAQVTLERQLKAITNLASDMAVSHGDFDLGVEQREQDADLRLLQTATGDRNHIISRILQRSARCFQQYRDAHANLEMLKEKHKASSTAPSWPNGPATYAYHMHSVCCRSLGIYSRCRTRKCHSS